jgi:outer membrane protein assembly factor BamB
VDVPLILDGAVFVAVDEPPAIWRIDLTTAQAKRWRAPATAAMWGMASDGTRIFAATAEAIHALAAEDAAPTWDPAPLPPLPAGAQWQCRGLKVADGLVFAPCQGTTGPQTTCLPEPLDPICPRPRIAGPWAGVFALDAERGDIAFEALRQYAAVDSDPATPGLEMTLYESVWTPAVVEERLYVPYISDSDGFPEKAVVEVWDVARGTFVGSFRPNQRTVGLLDGDVEAETQRAPPVVYQGSPAVAGSGDLVFAKAEFLYELDMGPFGPTARRAIDLDARDPGPTKFIENALAFDGSAVYLTHRDFLFSIDAQSGVEIWRMERPTGPYWSDKPHLLLVGPHVVVATAGEASEPDGATLYLVDASDGRVIDHAPAPEAGIGTHLAAGDGLVVAAGFTNATRIVVYGEPLAGIGLDVRLADRYPPAGRPVQLDLSGTRPGVQDGNTTYRIDWGDGIQDPWDNEPVREHEYVPGPSYTIVVQATNEAGQEARATFDVFPGMRDPNARTFLETAFASENQETSFFVLGVILTLLFAAFSVARLRRKRGLLRKELAAADAIVARHRDDPDTMRERLREHRLRARRLFLDGRLDEGSTGILERHIDELLRDHRLSRVEADLAFLPHGLFRSMQEMLRDARVTQLERNNFLIALAADTHLTAGEKKRVERHVETWHREDAA